MTPKSRTAQPAEKPARKGTARTSRPGAKSPVTTRKITADGEVTETKAPARKPRAAAKPKPTAKPTAKPSVKSKVAAKAKTNAKPAPAKAKQTDAERMKQIVAVGKLRGSGMKWDAIAETTGLSLSALARIRLVGKQEGVVGFTR